MLGLEAIYDFTKKSRRSIQRKKQMILKKDNKVHSLNPGILRGSVNLNNSSFKKKAFDI